MKIRGDLKILGDLKVTTRTVDPHHIPEDGRMLYSIDSEGNAMWGDLKIPELDTNKIYGINSIVINTLPGSSLVWVATVDGANGYNLAKGWMNIGAGGGTPGGTALYEIATAIPPATVPQDVGGVLSTYGTAGSFTPNVPISSVLDAILFPTITPTSTSETYSMTLKSSTGIDISDKLLEMGSGIDVVVKLSSTNGSWSPNGEKLYNTPTSWDFNMDGALFTGIAIDNKSTHAAGTKDTYTYSGDVIFNTGDIPTDNKSTEYPNLRRTGVAKGVGPLSFNFGYPILTAMLPLKKVTRVDLEAYLDRSMFAAAGSGILISKTTAALDVTTSMLGNISYPYVLVPTEYSKTLKSLFDNSGKQEYLGEMNKTANFYMQIGADSVEYSAWVFKLTTTITTADNKMLLTIN